MTIDLPSPPAASLMVRSLKGLWPQHVPAVAQTTTVAGGGRVLMTDGSSRSEVTPASPHSCPTQISLTCDLTLGLTAVLEHLEGYRTLLIIHREKNDERVDRWLLLPKKIYSVLRNSYLHFRGLYQSDQSVHVIKLLDTTNRAFTA